METLFNSYISVLRKARVEKSKPKVVSALFSAAKANLEPEENAMKKWLYTDGTKGRASDYFEGGKISDIGKDGFLVYLKSRAFIPWEELQDEFRSVDDLRFIDCETSDKDKFYRSLLNQFLAWLELPLLEESISEIKDASPNNNKSEVANQQSQSDSSAVEELSGMMNVVGKVVQENKEKDARIERQNALLETAHKDYLARKMPSVISNFYSPNGVPLAIKEDKELSEKMHDIEAEIQVNETIKSVSESVSALYRFDEDKMAEAFDFSIAEDVISLMETEDENKEISSEIEFMSLMFKAVDYMTKGNIDEALRCFHEVAEKSGEMACSIYPQIGFIYASNGDIETAIEYCNKALEIAQKIPEIAEVQMAFIYQQMAQCYIIEISLKTLKSGQETSEFEEDFSVDSNCEMALENLNKALELFHEKLGENHPNVAIIYQSIGAVYFVKENCEEKALEYFNKSFEIFRDQLGEDHPQTRKTRELIMKIEQE